MATRNPDDASEDPPQGVGEQDSSASGAVAQPHDALFRQVFGDPAHAAVVLRSILPPQVAAHIDWDTPFEPTHASVVSQGSEQRHGDMMFKARLVDGRGAFVWVLFEHQSTVQRWMPLRLSGMVQHFLDDWHRHNPKIRYLPVVLPVVLHHGPRPWRAPTSLLELMDVSEQARADLAPHVLSLDFVLDDLRTVPDEDIDARPLGPLLRLILGIMKHYRSPDLLGFYQAHAADIRALLASEHGRFGLLIAIRYTERVHPDLDQDTLIRHLAPVVGPGLEHTMLTFEQIIRNEALEEARKQVQKEVLEEARKEVQKEVFDKGVEKGIEKGIEKGMRELLLDLLAQRFGALPATITERVARAGREELQRWHGRALQAASLDDVFAAS